MISAGLPVHLIVAKLPRSTRSWFVVPLRMARHSFFGYMAAALALPSMRCTCRGHRPSHFLSSILKSSMLFVMNLVGFFAGTNWDLLLPHVINPYIHW